jgi:energy-coupling factor transport system ATP-binding protein
MQIVFDNVSYRYAPDAAPALNALNIRLDTSAIVGVCGTTGSGKSTFIQHLNGILKPTAGRVLIDGEDIYASKRTLRRIRQRIGMTFQFPERQLFGKTVWEELTYTLNYHHIPFQEQEQRVGEVCEWLEFDVDRYRNRSPFTLSRGEQRLLGIAVALCLQPELLVLDEPTAGMDRKHALHLLTLLQRLHRQHHRQIIVVSHHTELLLKYTEYMVVLSKGRCILAGTSQDIVTASDTLEVSGFALPIMYQIVKILESHRAPDKNVAELQDLARRLVRTY